jgi:hypothetical protein
MSMKTGLLSFELRAATRFLIAKFADFAPAASRWTQ